MKNRNTWLLVLAALLLLAVAPDLLAKKPVKPPPEPTPDPDPAIAYVERVRDTNKLMVMNADGSNQTVVLNAGTALVGYPDWSPDGTQIVFTSDIQGAGVYVIDVDGTGLRKVIAKTEPSTTFLGAAVWSPAPVPGVGGSMYRIAYTDRTAGDGRPDLHIVTPDGTGHVQLTSTPDQGEAYPTWSPSGTKLAFRVSEYLVNDLWGLFDFSSGTHTVQRHEGPLAGQSVNHPAWSRTQEDKIAWVAGEKIWIVDLDDPSDPVRLSSDAGIVETAVSWSPDDTEVVLSSARKKGKKIGNHAIEVMSATDGSDRRTIASGDYKFSPCWMR